MTFIENKKIPLFYHIPRCAGTYILRLLNELFKLYSISQDGGNIHKTSFEIFKDNHLCFRITAYNPRQSCDYVIDYKYLYRLKNLNIFSAIVEPHGFVLRNEFLEIFNQYNFKSFLPLRDPYDRAKSLYYYLNSDNSKHEYTHNKLTMLSFESYLISHLLENGWLIRQLLNLPDNVMITEKEYYSTIKILDNMMVYPFENFKTVIDKIFLECWGVSSSQIPAQIFKSFDIYKNQSNKNIVSLSEMPNEVQNKFLSRTFWDYKLYNYYKDKLNF